MHAVVFQFRPHPEHRGTYFGIVAELRPELQRVPGFLANERFASRTDPHGLVSISLWEDEDAIRRWRAHAGHRVAQARGKREVFAGYRLRVGEAVADGDGDLRLAIGPGLEPAPGAEAFDGIPDPDRRLVLGACAASAPEPERVLVLRVLRDYGPDAPARGEPGR